MSFHCREDSQGTQLIKGRRWQESTGKMAKSWGFYVSASQSRCISGYRWGEGDGAWA